MGITGLLPFLEKASKKCNVTDFKGCTVAVDTYCWLHKGAFSCADKLARGEYCDTHIKYCMKYVNMLLSHSIKPILVFDGRHLPAKALTEAKRRESRNTAKKRAAELLRLGQIDEARSYMRRSVDITHEMALELIKICRQRNIDCIVAPYEADAQMAYLNKLNIAQIIITEDSDLILFGGNKIFYKMDLNGNGVLVESSKLPLVMKCPLEHFSFNKFLQMCIMSGCDYLPSLPGIGLAKARQFINATRDPDIKNALRKLPSYFNKSQMIVTEEYRNDFLKAEATFKHQLVYDPLQRKLVPLNNVEDEGTDPDMCSNAGAFLDPGIAFQLALGNLDPFSLKKMDDWNPDDPKSKPTGGKTNGWNQCSIAPHKSIWSKEFSEHIKQSSAENLKEKHVTAISIPSTRLLTTKIINPRVKECDKGLTIEDLSSIYCVKEEKKNFIVPETQDLDDINITESKTLFSLKSPERISRNFACGEISSNKKRRRESPEKENTLSPKKGTSPIIESKSRSYKNLAASHSFMSFSRFSKFRRTTLDEKNHVESKFFSTSTHNIETKEESDLNVSSIGNLNMDDSEVIPETEMITCVKRRISDILESENGPIGINVHNKQLTVEEHAWTSDFKCETKKNDSDLICEGLKKIVNPFKKNNLVHQKTDSEISYNDNTYPLEDLITPIASQICTDDIDTINCSNSSENPKLNITRSQPTISTTQMNKTMSSKQCRRTGLQRKPSVSATTSQQSLLTNFGFFKKSQLKH